MSSLAPPPPLLLPPPPLLSLTCHKMFSTYKFIILVDLENRTDQETEIDRSIRSGHYRDIEVPLHAVQEMIVLFIQRISVSKVLLFRRVLVCHCDIAQQYSPPEHHLSVCVCVCVCVCVRVWVCGCMCVCVERVLPGFELPSNTVIATSILATLSPAVQSSRSMFKHTTP